MSRRIVCDTGPLVCLQEADLLHLLSKAGEIHIPPTVRDELESFEVLPGWLHVTPLREPASSEAKAWQRAGLLDPGEAEAIALTKQLHATWLLTDDAAARLLAHKDGLEVHGSLGLVLWASAAGHLDVPSGLEVLDRLAASSLWVSSRVLSEAKTALEQLAGHRE